MSENEIVTHNIPSRIGKSGIDFEEFYFPINHSLVRKLLGEILTQVEAMNLPEKSESAVKSIFIQMVWRWFDYVMDNSDTSSNDCIAPIMIKKCSCDDNSACSKCPPTWALRNK